MRSARDTNDWRPIRTGSFNTGMGAGGAGSAIDTEDEINNQGGLGSPSSAARQNAGLWLKKRDELISKFESLRDC